MCAGVRIVELGHCHLVCSLCIKKHALGVACGVDDSSHLTSFGLYIRTPWQDVNVTVGAAPTVFHHKAELHWNIFGSQPRMFRGTVTRDRLPKSFLPPWLFRPVTSSFVGSGVGDDTADKSYRHRQISRSSEDGTTPPRVAPQTDRY